ncbi:hypothetical protein DPMN_043181 [Dreissena polymorpha]|uniref:Hexosyltransferase n=1 Tax=Dreissena polymorpha TaxID=45954 RepID=A0A9D4D2C3_DREPO|nr:hypothetical protein DPMN_043181 [Dreissena polymorpha]
MMENKIYHDIVQENFIDSYTNLTYKTIMGFKWASTKFSNVQFVMKTDDDMWFNVPSIIKLLSGTDMANCLQTGLTGSCYKKGSPIRDNVLNGTPHTVLIRKRFSKGFVQGLVLFAQILVVVGA